MRSSPARRSRALSGIAERHGLVVISDEVYEDIVFDGLHSSVASLGGDAPVVSVFSFSKGYAMTGWRIGYLAAPAAIAEAVVKAQEAVVACPSSLAQHAAHAALSGPRDCLDDMRDEYRARRDLAVQRLETEGLLLTRPRGTFYIMADIARSGLDSYEFARRLLVERGVAVAPGGAFGDEAELCGSPVSCLTSGNDHGRDQAHRQGDSGARNRPGCEDCEIMTAMDRSSVDWHGYIPAMVTPFTRDGDLDRERLLGARRVARR